MIDLGKAIMAQKEDEIKKGQALFVKRLNFRKLLFFRENIQHTSEQYDSV